MKIRYKADALRESKEATRFYRNHEGTGKRFAGILQETLDLICAAPRQFRTIGRGIRRCLFSRVYPYVVIYSIEKDHILIIAVMHCSRDPDYWHPRIKKPK